MIRYILDDLKEQLVLDPQQRVYIDPRQAIFYPLPGDSLQYTEATALDNSPGHYRASGRAEYLLGLGVDTWTVELFIRRTSQAAPPARLFGFSNGEARIALDVDGNEASISFTSDVQPGDNIETDPVFTVSNTELNDWGHWVMSWRSGSHDELEVALWVNGILRAEINTTGNGALYGDRSRTRPLMFVDFPVGEFEIANLSIIPGHAATADDVKEWLRWITHEQIYFGFEGVGVGRTRCNVSRFVTSLFIGRSSENPANGASIANTCAVTLLSREGEFADDQYNGFAPEQGLYNGFIDDKFLQHQCPMYVEADFFVPGSEGLFPANDLYPDEELYPSPFAGERFTREPVFVGRVNEALFTRMTSNDDTSTVEISGECIVATIARANRRNGRFYEDHKLVDAEDETNSVFHKLVRLATDHEVHNFAPELAEFVQTGTSTGTMLAPTPWGPPRFSVTQPVGGIACECTFTGNELSKGDKFEFCASVHINADAEIRMRIFEVLPGPTTNLIGETTYAQPSAIGPSNAMRRVYAQIQNENAVGVRAEIELMSGSQMIISAPALTRQWRPPTTWFTASPTTSLGQTVDTDAGIDIFNTVGIDAETVDIVHPWAVVEPDDPIWDYCQEIADATVARYMGADETGVIRFRALLAKTGDPPVLETIDESEVQHVETIIALERSNKLIVHGVQISKQDVVRALWQAVATGHFDYLTAGSNGGEVMQEEIAPSGLWPDPVKYGEYFARLTEDD